VGLNETVFGMQTGESIAVAAPRHQKDCYVTFFSIRFGVVQAYEEDSINDGVPFETFAPLRKARQLSS
jgi:hypothetical protein